MVGEVEGFVASMAGYVIVFVEVALVLLMLADSESEER